jgi:3-deoxy-D-manno-octulosonate 8-phosphate phosphatase (KDO 8-P phosphatase)
MSEQRLNASLLERAKNINLLLMDCDGVLTDGKLYYSATGEDLKVFNVKDGQGIVNWHKAGFRSGIITGRSSQMLKIRAEELGIEFVRQSSKDKVSDLADIIAAANVTREEVAFIGDDLPDLAVFEHVGFSIAVADSVKELIGAADYVTISTGGNGAVREAIDLIIGAKITH